MNVVTKKDEHDMPHNNDDEFNHNNDEDLKQLLKENNLPEDLYEKIVEAAMADRLDQDEEEDEDVIATNDLEPETNDISETQEDAENQETVNSEVFTVTEKVNIKWTHNKHTLQPSDAVFTAVDDGEVPEILSPLTYFMKYIPEDLFVDIAKYTNMYALQSSSKNFKHCTCEEIKILFGLHIAAGTLGFPRIILYWDRALGISLFSDSMSRDRFFTLRNNLHFVDNLQKPKDCKDIFYKVRPLYNSIRERCKQLTLSKVLSVDEQMIPFTGRSAAKQYAKLKPNPWGIKCFLLCGNDGMAYDFVLYQGSSTEIDNSLIKKFGFGAAIVLTLTKRISGLGHCLYFDNYFSSYNLLQILKSKNIYASCTVRINRFRNPPFTSDKQIRNTLKDNQRGYSEELYNEDGDVILTKWVDNRSVILGSNYVGIGETDEVKRYCKIKKKLFKLKDHKW